MDDTTIWTPVFVLINAILLFVARQPVRLYVAMLFVSSIYYGVLGPWYWETYHSSSFLGVYWGDELPRASAYLTLSATLLATFATGLQQLNLFRQTPTNYITKTIPDNHAISQQFNIFRWSYILFCVIATAASLYVMAFMTAGDTDRLQSDKAILIAYQASDLGVACILFAVGRNGYTKPNVLAIALFTAYAVSIGFRYKLVMLFFPLIWLMYSNSIRIGWIAVGRAAAFTAIVVASFSLLTLTRTKFGGLDMSGLAHTDFGDAVYGLFAETNSMFGLVGVIKESIDAGATIGLTPVSNTVLELVPRFLYPTRVTGEYLSIPLQQLIASEALTSNTAYPLVGELLLMGGPLALILGSALWAAAYFALAHSLWRKTAHNYQMFQVGSGLFAVFFGYYAFSRGYLPQAFKGVIFFIFPFAWLVHCDRASTTNKTTAVCSYA